jgi:hypothetical protein
MPSWIDGSLYPDQAVPAAIESLADRVDFLVRLCAAWDFGVLPSRETVAEVRHPHWHEAAEAACLLTSPSYHLVRSWHGLPPVPYLGQQLAYIRDDPSLQFV